MPSITPWNKGLKTAPRITISCSGCNKQFSITLNSYNKQIAASSKRHLFCSKLCFYEHRSKELNPIYGKTNHKLVICKTCNCKFEVIKSSKQIYCCHSCQHVALKGRKNPSHGEWMKANYDFKNKDRIEKISNASKSMWRQLELDGKKDERIKAALSISRPTSFETFLIALFSKYNLPFKYVGNGAVILDGKNPDFINDMSKIIIDVSSSYFKKFHYANREAYEQDRTQRFAKFGYRTLILWEEDLTEDIVLNKIKRMEES